MKYFTKFIPVEGEIKEGDIIRSETFGILKMIERIGSFFDCVRLESKNARLTANPDKCKKVKLFLCSRDIEVGDKITLDGIEFATYEGNDYDSSWEELVINGFKVIGEISSAALNYVNEGDIDESLLEFYGPDTDPEGWVKEHWGEIVVYGRASEPPRPFVKIKGPCGHFH